FEVSDACTVEIVVASEIDHDGPLFFRYLLHEAPPFLLSRKRKKKADFQTVLTEIDRQAKLTNSGFPKSKTRVRGSDVSLGQAQLFPHNVCALHQGHAFIEGNAAREALAAKAAIRRDDQALGRHILQSLADQVRDQMGWLYSGHRMIDYTNSNLLVCLVLFE